MVYDPNACAAVEFLSTIAFSSLQPYIEPLGEATTVARPGSKKIQRDRFSPHVSVVIRSTEMAIGRRPDSEVLSSIRRFRATGVLARIPDERLISRDKGSRMI